MQYLALLVGLLKSYFDDVSKGYRILLVQQHYVLCLIIPRILGLYCGRERSISYDEIPHSSCEISAVCRSVISASS